jgi:hypothetical protein
VPHVGEAAERDAEEGVEDAEDGAVEEADLGIADAEVGLDVLGQDRHDLPVDEVEDVDEDEDAQHVPAVGAADAGFRFGDFGFRWLHPSSLSQALRPAPPFGPSRRVAAVKRVF